MTTLVSGRAPVVLVLSFALWQSAACGPVTIFEIGSSGGGSGTPDTQNPETLLVTVPADFVNEESARFEFAANEAVARFEVRVFPAGTPPGEWSAASSPYTAHASAGDGTYTLECRAVDLAGNVDVTPPSRTWSVDRVRPLAPATLTVVPTQTTILEIGWASAADASGPVISGVAGYRIHYQTDPGTPNANEGPSPVPVGLLNSVRLTGLAPCRVYTVRVATVDRAGNESDPLTGVVRVLRAWCGWDGTFSSLLYPVGLAPEGLVAADFDTDGITDLAVLNRGSEDVSVLLGRKGAELQEGAQSPHAAGAGPVAMVSADFDRDGSPDLLALGAPVAGTRRVTMLYGACGGSFGRAFQAGSFGGGASTCLATADWTGSAGGSITADGAPDILVGETYARACSGGNEVCSNGCSPPNVFEEICGFDVAAPVIACTTGDFNMDGRPDAAVLTDDGRVRVHRFGSQGGGPNECSGFCAELPVLLSFAGPGASCIVTADFDADGILDLALGNAQASVVSVLYGNGNGTFSTFAYPAGAPVNGLVVTDLDADGIADLAAATATGYSVLLGNGSDGVGDGTFAAPIVGQLGYATHSVAAGDFDADGILDLALSAPSLDAVCVLSGEGGTRQGDGSFLPGALSLPREAVDVVRGDFDRDGILDLATGSEDGVTDVFLGNGREGRGDGTFRSAASYVVPQSTEYRNFAWEVGDFDGDRTLDLLVNAEIFSGGKQFGRSFLLRGTGSPGLPFLEPGSSQPSVYLRAMLVADFDGDGLADLVGFDPDPDLVRIRFGDASSPLAGGSSIDVQGQALAFAPADFDRDGRTDLAIGVSSAVRIALKGANAHEFSLQPTAYAVPGIAVRSIVASDFDADGITDLAVVGSSALRVLLGRGTDCVWSGFADATVIDAGHSFEGLTAGDFDGDGITDLVATETTGAVFLRGTGRDGRGDGGFADPVPIPGPLPGRANRAVVTGDFDSDGSLDLVLTNDLSPLLSVLLGGAGAP